MDSLYGMDPAELAGSLSLSPSFRARQVYAWLARGVMNFSDMTDLPREERERLCSLYPRIPTSESASELSDSDGSLKLQIRLSDGAAVECVLLEDIEGRRTACLSSQVGCPMGCAFCKTGGLGYLRDLSAGEIMEQFHFLRARSYKDGEASSGSGATISNVVFMGMGEPMANLTAVRKAIGILSGEIGMSLRKITISTCGLVPGILELAKAGPAVRLAVSLTVADDELRSRLMPVNKSYNLAALKEALTRYQEATGERITLECAIMGGVNASPESARKLLSWIGKLKVQVNVIPWNAVPGLPFSTPSRDEIAAYMAVLEAGGVVSVRRMSRGRGVMGACGQLGDTLLAGDACGQLGDTLRVGDA
jgi:23S rRNA (adenine2503-C2)-methyltransferase